MDKENPYQSPSALVKEARVSPAPDSYSTEQCPNCQVKVTFGMALMQRNPFRFKCTRCKAKYRIHTPYMIAIFAGVCVVAFLVTVGAILAFGWTGVMGLLYLFPFVGVFWVLVELWTYWYIKRQGRFLEL